MLSDAAFVAPLAGAWIETQETITNFATIEVAPLAGAWIETIQKNVLQREERGRAPRGRVD